MIIKKIKLRNWRNFQEAEADLDTITYVLGPNASGKSNFLDVFRFLRDIVNPDGGGLQKAISKRGGLSKVRCLHARSKPEVMIDIELRDTASSVTGWRYELSFTGEGKGRQRPVVKREKIIRLKADGTEKLLLERPDDADRDDEERLIATAIENVNVNKAFRELSEMLRQTLYLHLVPQLLKFADQIGGNKLEDDPFGQGFLEQVSKSSDKSRKTRLNRIETALKSVVPSITDLKFIKDEISGRPHLEINYKHHRPNGAIQREDQFSDGTLRLIALLWMLQDGESLLLLEEPELSLNSEIVSQIPRLITSIQRQTKKTRQILISTHSEALLSNVAIPAKSTIILVPSEEGTSIRPPDEAENLAVEAGFSVAEAILPNARRLQAQMELGL